MKKCSKCKNSKELTEFYKKSASKDGYRSECKECSKKYSDENSEVIKEYRNKRYKELKNTDEYKKKRNKYYLENKEHSLEKSKKWRDNNQEKLSEQKKEYYQLNKESILEQRKVEYQKVKSNKELLDKKREKDKVNTKKWRDNNKEVISEKVKLKKKADPLYKMADSIRTLIWNSIKKMGYNKSSKTNLILGCSFEEFKSYIEYQFQEGMSWENHGEWHLDHKTPISWAESEEMVLELNHYTNFQPLWAKDNLAKGNKWSD
jgi:hypothetical protein